ncbi:MAG: class I SAM-dependent methyltransferase [Bacteroidales bacterium]
MGKIKLLIKYFVYKFRCKGAKGHGIHSPFVFDLNRKVLNTKSEYPEYEEIKKFRRSLVKNREKIRVEDYGAGSVLFSSPERRVCDIALFAASSQKTGRLLFRLARYLRPAVTVELGTSLGFGTLCLAMGGQEGKVYSLDGCRKQLAIAAGGLKRSGINNVELIPGSFKDTLPGLMKRLDKVDLVYFDGDHRKESLIWQYGHCVSKAVPGSVFVIGDIHWSDGMEEAWKVICDDPAVTLSADLFYCGLLFFRKGMVKQHIILTLSG